MNCKMNGGSGEKRCGLHPTHGRADTAHSLCRCAVNRGRQTFRQRGHGHRLSHSRPNGKIDFFPKVSDLH